MHPNLVDHLKAFIAVAEASGFSEAARRLNCAVSSVSYSVTTLEELCGFPLFMRGRKSELTERGRALFREAQAVVESSRRFKAHALSLERGQETRIRVAIDVLFPADRLMSALTRFAHERPHVTLQIFATSLNRFWDDLRAGTIDFGVAPLQAVPTDVDGMSIGLMEVVPVAAREHPLALQPGPLQLSELQRHRQLYYVGSPNVDVERRGRVFSTDYWTGSDLEHIRTMIVRGFGWAFATREFFRNELASGEIVELDCADAHLQPKWSIGAIWRIDRPPGPLSRELITLLADQNASGGPIGEPAGLPAPAARNKGKRSRAHRADAGNTAD